MKSIKIGRILFIAENPSFWYSLHFVSQSKIHKQVLYFKRLEISR